MGPPTYPPGSTPLGGGAPAFPAVTFGEIDLTIKAFRLLRHSIADAPLAQRYKQGARRAFTRDDRYKRLAKGFSSCAVPAGQGRPALAAQRRIRVSMPMSGRHAIAGGCCRRTIRSRATDPHRSTSWSAAGSDAVTRHTRAPMVAAAASLAEHTRRPGTNPIGRQRRIARAVRVLPLNHPRNTSVDRME